MRLPFLTGLLDRTRERARIVFARGKAPEPIPGPWVLRALVRDQRDRPGRGEAPPKGRETGEERA